MNLPDLRSFLVLAMLLVSAPLPAADEWPQFRGPGGEGMAETANPPLAWSETQNVRWKTAIHGRGWSSPVVWGDQIWMTTATADGRELFAVGVDRTTGKIVYDLKVFDVEKPEEIHALNSYASPSPVIEAGRVWLHFGTYGTICLETATGKTVWVRRDLNCDHFRGPGSSPFLYGNLLILHFDGIDVQYLVALDKLSGKTVWKTDRSTDFGNMEGDLRKAYATPLVIPAGDRKLLVSPGAKAAMAYVPETGEEVWKIRYGGFSNASRPVFGGGLVLINTGFGKADLWAVRPDGRGDVTDSHVVWKATRNVPCKPSPLVIGDLVYMVDDKGIASCLELQTGETVWRERIGGDHSASPTYAGGRIYVFDQSSTATVLAPGRQFQVLAVNTLDDGCMASPAALEGALFVRTRTHLYRIESSQATTALR